MAQATEAKPIEATITTHDHSFAHRRWFSLIGLVPLGAYVVMHLLSVSQWWSGPDAYDAAIRASHGSWLTWLGTVVLLSFVGYHAVIGLQQIGRARMMSPKPTRVLHWTYILQRIAGLGILAFIPAHVYKAKIGPALAGTPETFAGMHQAFAETPEHLLTLGVYLLGTAGVAYHLAHGLWTASVSFGLVQSAAAQRRMQYVSVGFFLFLITLAYGTILKIVIG
jgi:succinate dehydrogenase / fumarate reductase cytochrome b subunit